jgi:hypothetical protein
MDVLAHRVLKAARDQIVDGLQLFATVPASATPAEIAAGMPGNLSTEQFKEICDITERLWSLMLEDPFPPECQYCGETLAGQSSRSSLLEEPQSTGRPRRYCSDKCRQAAYRERQGDQAST